MSDNSKIEWTDATWNPIRGCTKVSQGCAHCYAETFAERFRGVPGHPFEFGFDLRLVPEKLNDPLRWGTSRMVFVNSMSDLFHKDVPDDYIVSVARVMTAANCAASANNAMRQALPSSLSNGVALENLPPAAHSTAAPTVNFQSGCRLNLQHWIFAGQS
jgi:hypothetical protein